MLLHDGPTHSGQRADFFRIVDEWRQQTANAYATYTHEQRFLFRENQPILLNQQDAHRFQVRRNLEYYYIRTGGTTIEYDRCSLESIAKSKGKTLEADLYYCLLERRGGQSDVDPWLRDVHPEVQHAPYDGGSYIKHRNLHRFGWIVSQGEVACTLRRVITERQKQLDPQREGSQAETRMTQANQVIAEELNREVQDIVDRSAAGVHQENREREAAMGRSLSPQEKEGPPATFGPKSTRNTPLSTKIERDDGRPDQASTRGSAQSGTDSAVSYGQPDAEKDVPAMEHGDTLPLSGTPPVASLPPMRSTPYPAKLQRISGITRCAEDELIPTILLQR